MPDHGGALLCLPADSVTEKCDSLCLIAADGGEHLRRTPRDISPLLLDGSALRVNHCRAPYPPSHPCCTAVVLHSTFPALLNPPRLSVSRRSFARHVRLTHRPARAGRYSAHQARDEEQSLRSLLCTTSALLGRRRALPQLLTRQPRLHLQSRTSQEGTQGDCVGRVTQGRNVQRSIPYTCAPSCSRTRAVPISARAAAGRGRQGYSFGLLLAQQLQLGM